MEPDGKLIKMNLKEKQRVRKYKKSSKPVDSMAVNPSLAICIVTTCLENLEMLGNLIAVSEMCGNLGNFQSVWEGFGRKVDFQA